MGLIGLIMAYYGGLSGTLTGLSKSTDHPSRSNIRLSKIQQGRYLESQVAKNNGPLEPKVAHNSLEVARTYRPLAFQVCHVQKPAEYGRLCRLGDPERRRRKAWNSVLCQSMAEVSDIRSTLQSYKPIELREGEPSLPNEA